MERLGRAGSISHNFVPPNLRDVNGNNVNACGTISLEWLWKPNGNTINDCDFYVFANADIDVIFGVQYIVTNRLVEIPKDVMLPLVEHRKQSLSE